MTQQQQKNTNQVRISGTVYNVKQIQTKTGKTMTMFGLMFASKKQPDGKFKGSFVNIKSFEEGLDPNMLQNKVKIIVEGYINLNEYTNRDGKEISGFEIMANKIYPAVLDQHQSSLPPQRSSFVPLQDPNPPKDANNNFFEEENIPF